MSFQSDLERFECWGKIPEILIKRGEELLSQPYHRIEFTHVEGADDLLNDLQNYPHAFVLACVMNRQIKAERVWMIPYLVAEELGDFSINTLLSTSLDSFVEMFTKQSYHRFNVEMAKYFFQGIKRIHENYNNDASGIWRNNPGSASVVRKFLQFGGVGIKIATMATNILSRDFRIPFKEKLYIDISPDVHVMRVFKRLLLIDWNATADELIYCARELHPEYPGIFDLSAWEIGRNWCSPNPDKMKCAECYLDNYCAKLVYLCQAE
ncbi:iron-sulfur cluster loop [Chloroflexota bacterium]